MPEIAESYPLVSVILDCLSVVAFVIVFGAAGYRLWRYCTPLYRRSVRAPARDFYRQDVLLSHISVQLENLFIFYILKYKIKLILYPYNS